MNTLATFNSEISTRKYWEFVVPPLTAEMVKQSYHARQDATYYILIDCPEHLTHKAKLYTFPHRYASVWECPFEGTTDSCPHFDTKTEKLEPTVSINVCVLCDIGVVPEFEGFDCD